MLPEWIAAVHLFDVSKMVNIVRQYTVYAMRRSDWSKVESYCSGIYFIYFVFNIWHFLFYWIFFKVHFFKEYIYLV